jgi:hypothetical protein
MPEVSNTDTLERLYRRIAELEADLRLTGSTIEVLERIVLGKRLPNAPVTDHDNWEEIAEADLFAEDLQNQREDQ